MAAGLSKARAATLLPVPLALCCRARRRRPVAAANEASAAPHERRDDLISRHPLCLALEPVKIPLSTAQEPWFVASNSRSGGAAPRRAAPPSHFEPCNQCRWVGYSFSCLASLVPPVPVPDLNLARLCLGQLGDANRQHAVGKPLRRLPQAGDRLYSDLVERLAAQLVQRVRAQVRPRQAEPEIVLMTRAAFEV